MKTIIINGNNFNDLETFFTEIDKVLAKDLTWRTGNNLDAFNDLLKGGFGVFEYEEPIKLIWQSFSKSELELGHDFINKVVESIGSNSHIEFSTIK